MLDALRLAVGLVLFHSDGRVTVIELAALTPV